MKKLLNFKTDRGQAVIELLENDFVNFWLSHFLKVQKNYNLTAQRVNWPYNKKIKLSNDVKLLIEKLITTINSINQLEYLVPIPETISEDQLLNLDLSTQQCLNRLHRYLVVATEYRNRWTIDGPSVFTVCDDDTEFMYLLNLANQTIHALEEYVQVPNKINFNSMLKFNEIVVNGSKYNDVNVYADDIDLAIPDSMQTYLKLFGYDVWIKKDILGKDFITAFADHDDPNAFDVRPPPMISGGFIVDKDQDFRRQFFQSKDFVSWLGHTPTDYNGSYPLGNVLSGKENIISCNNIDFISIDNV